VAGIGPLEKIKHIVVLMMENRSFDHMLRYRRMTACPRWWEAVRMEFRLSPVDRCHPGSEAGAR
jgi:Phosphoesterase family